MCSSSRGDRSVWASIPFAPTGTDRSKGNESRARALYWALVAIDQGRAGLLWWWTYGTRGEPGYLLAQDALAYADTLFTLARYLSGNETDAEDLVQETYARALHAADRFRLAQTSRPSSSASSCTFLSQARRRRSSPIVGGLDTVQPIHADAAADNWLRDDVELDRLRKKWWPTRSSRRSSASPRRLAR